jgi:hypothetical protein
MADAQNENQYFLVVDAADDPVVANSILPKLAKLGTLKG